MALDEALVREIEAGTEGGAGRHPIPSEAAYCRERLTVSMFTIVTSSCPRFSHRRTAARARPPGSICTVCTPPGTARSGAGAWGGTDHGGVVNADPLEADRRFVKGVILMAHGQIPADEIEIRGIRGFLQVACETPPGGHREALPTRR